MVPRLIIFILVLLIGLGNLSYSLTIARATLEELISESELIVYARVARTECRWEDEALKTINTFSELEVRETFKGKSWSAVKIKQLGGQLGEWEMVISGTPYLQPGEEAIFFLVPEGDYYAIHSMALGLFRVFEDENGQPKVINDLHDINLLDPLTQAEVTSNDKLQTFDLLPFIDRIRSFCTER